MNINSSFYVITHKEVPWHLPFPHTLIGVEGYDPRLKGGLASGEIISRALDAETAFGGMRALMAMNASLSAMPSQHQVFCGSYRLFLGKEMSSDWLSPVMQEVQIITPSDLSQNWQDIIATEIPPDVDILVPAPRLLPDTVLGQYSRVHHLDDLLLMVGCAVREGVLDAMSIPAMLQTNLLVPYGIFAARKELRAAFNERIWSLATKFYKQFYIPRAGYQRRVIDFAMERVVSMAVVQMIIRGNLRCMSCRNVVVSSDGTYLESK